MSFISLISKMLVLFFFLLIGILCDKLKFLDEHSGKKLNKVVLNICAPALVFNSVLTTEYTYSVGDILTLFVDAALFEILMLLVSLVLVLILYRKHQDRGVYQFMIAFGNTVFMGFPILASLYGNSAVFLGSICSMPFNILVYSVGVMIISGGKGKNHSFWKLLLNPPFLSNVVAFFLFLLHVKAPDPVNEALGYLGNMVVPLSMMLIGLSLGAMKLKEIFSDWRVYILCLCKLIIAPAIIYFVCRIFISDELFLDIITVSAVMPTAAISPILCAEYGGNTQLASKGVFITTLCSLATIPLMLSLLLI